MYDVRTSLTHQVENELREHFQDKVFKCPIPRNVRLAEAPSHGKPVLTYDFRSKGAQCYLELAREFLASEAARASNPKAISGEVSRGAA